MILGACAAPETPVEPVIKMVQPPCGPAEGGNVITVIGDGFEEGMQIRFGPSLLETTFVDSKHLEAAAPAPEEAETFPIAVINSEGGVEAVRTMAYRYKDPGTFDPNGDCGVSTADVHYLSNYLSGGGKAPVLSGDADGDGDVDREDVDHLIRFLFADGEPPIGEM